jgi:hypothetical protein
VVLHHAVDVYMRREWVAMTELTGSIIELKSRVNASGETINVLKLEVFGDIHQVHELLKKPLRINLETLEQ